MRPSRFPLIVTLLVFLFFYAPLGMMVVRSLLEKVHEKTPALAQAEAVNAAEGDAAGDAESSQSAVYSAVQTPQDTHRWQWTTKRYARLMNNPQVLAVTMNTIIIGMATALFSTFFGTLSALAVFKYKSKLQAIHRGLLYVPLVLPEILVGISLLICFTAVKSTMGVEFGKFSVIAAHTSFCTSYVAIVVMASLMNFDFTLQEASRDLGATSWQTTWRVILPLLWPAIAAGALLAFTLSLDDFIITFFVAERNSTTLPVYIYSLFKHRSQEDIYALSSVLLGATFLLVAIIMLFAGRNITQAES